MAKKDKLTEVSVKIGTALGKANSKARQLSKAGQVAKQELHAISKQVDELKRQLEKTTKRLKKAIT
jgi:predicted  nucleic acid-binding Zn-ribbon protein